jgi:type IV pilus assembly protein PilV
MPNNTSQSGFTLVELLIAAVIIAVGILGWAKTQEGSIKGRAISNGITTASEMALASLEDFSLKYQKSPPDTNIGPTTDPEIKSQGVGYTRTWSISKDKIKSTIWVIDVTISWNHYGPHSVQYQRVIGG